MEKIPTLFVRDQDNMALVTREINPRCADFFNAISIIPTIKRDGTNIRLTIFDECVTKIEKRRNPSREARDAGEHPGYVEASRSNPSDKHIFACVDAIIKKGFAGFDDGEYCCEAIGPNIQGGVESSHPTIYFFHAFPDYISRLDLGGDDFNFDGLRNYLAKTVIEGIVFQYKPISGASYPWKFAKIKRRDFGFEWPRSPIKLDIFT